MVGGWNNGDCLDRCEQVTCVSANKCSEDTSLGAIYGRMNFAVAPDVNSAYTGAAFNESLRSLPSSDGAAQYRAVPASTNTQYAVLAAPVQDEYASGDLLV
jgi:hypothetical protein